MHYCTTKQQKSAKLPKEPASVYRLGILGKGLGCFASVKIKLVMEWPHRIHGAVLAQHRGAYLILLFQPKSFCLLLAAKCLLALLPFRAGFMAAFIITGAGCMTRYHKNGSFRHENLAYWKATLCRFSGGMRWTERGSPSTPAAYIISIHPAKKRKEELFVKKSKNI